MRRVGQARKRDANEPPIVAALQRIGVKVKRISEPGFADLVAWHPTKKILKLLEVKGDKGKLTAAQVEHHDGWPVVIVRSEADAVALFT